MFILQKNSDPKKFVQTYYTETGAFIETYEGAPPVTFATQEEAMAVMKLINDANDPSNHVSVKVADKEEAKEEAPEDPKPAAPATKKATSKKK